MIPKDFSHDPSLGLLVLDGFGIFPSTHSFLDSKPSKET